MYVDTLLTQEKKGDVIANKDYSYYFCSKFAYYHERKH